MPPRKRQAVEAPATPETSGGRRRSTRISSAGKKSQYFDDDSDSDDHLSDAPTGKGKANGKKTTPQRGRGKPTAKKAKIAHDEDDDEDVYAAPESEEDGPAKYENDEEDDDDFDEDGAPRVTIIPHVKLRDTGGVDYEDDRLHKNTLLFLNDLRANNRRPWLKCMFFVSCLLPTTSRTQTLVLLVKAPVLTCCYPTTHSPRRRIPPRPQGLEHLRRDLHAEAHRPRPDHPRAPPQGRRLPHLPRHPLHQRPDPLQSLLLRRVVADGAQGPLRLLLPTRRPRRRVRRRRAVAP